MKKLIFILSVMALILAMIVTASATGGFSSSPSQKQAPTLVEAIPEVEGSDIQIEIKAYGDRDQMSQEVRQQIEAAYSSIAGAKTITELNKQLDSVAKELGLSIQNLSVGELFDISCMGCEDHDQHGAVTITLGSEYLENFVCLIHFVDNQWTIVNNAKLSEDGKTIQFKEKGFSPFAIVVNTPNADIIEDTDEGNSALVWIVCGSLILAAAIIAGAVFFVNKRRI